MLIQIQSVIFKNDPQSLIKAIKALHQAIVVYNRVHTEKLEARLVYGDGSPENVLKGDNFNEIERILGMDMQFVYHPFGCNTGTAKGHNIMTGLYPSDYTLIMNPDVILEPQCLVRLLAPFADENVAITEARQTPLEHAKTYDEKTGETEWASTACTVIRSKALQEVEGFDADTFFMYCDDLDFSWRIRLTGYKILYVPSAIVYHAKNLSNEAKWMPTGAEVYYSAEAAILLAYKWSNSKRAKHLCNLFEQHGSSEEQRAASTFEKREKEGHLPKQLDGEHKIARFTGDDYCDMRFRYK